MVRRGIALSAGLLGSALVMGGCAELGGEPDAEGTTTQQASLPSGTVVDVAIDTPADGTSLPQGPVEVTGTAQVGVTIPVADTGIVYVIDVSGSTIQDSTAGCAGDINGDGRSNTILDCEIAALIAVNQEAIASKVIDEVGIVAFGNTGFAADVDSALAGVQPVTSPGATASGASDVLDVDEVLRSTRNGRIQLFTSATPGSGTSYGAALTAANTILGQMTSSNKLVVFVSDGDNLLAPNIAGPLGEAPAGTVFHTFAVGDGASCDDNAADGNLRQIAGMTGTCTNVTDASTLPDILPALIKARLDAVRFTVDGGAVIEPAVSVDTTLPAEGPVTATWSIILEGLTPGPHELCALADGSDGSGMVTAEHCIQVIINTPPVAMCQDLTLIADASCQADGSIDAGSNDPDGPAPTCTTSPEGPYGLGTTDATLSCTDAFGAADACTAVVTVVDETAPMLSCPASQVLECTGGGAIATFDVGATDNCGLTAHSCSAESGATFPAGSTTVACEAADASGNAASCAFDVDVVDTGAPTVELAPGRIQLWPPNHAYHDFSLADCVAAVVDTCEGALDVGAVGSITRITSDEAEDAKGSGKTCEDAVITGATTARLRAERAGPQDGRVYTVHFQVTDGAGNSTAASCQVEVPHDQSGAGAVDSGCALCVGADCGACAGPDPSCK